MLCSLTVLHVFEIFFLYFLKVELILCPGLDPDINSVEVNHTVYGIMLNMHS